METYAYSKRKADSEPPKYKSSGYKKTKNKYVLASRFAKRTLLQKENATASNAPEKKAIDNSETETVTTANQVNLLNGLAKGDDINNRQGRKVTMKSLKLRIMAFSVAATTAPGFIRWIVVYDKQANGTTVTGANVFTSDDALNMNNLNNRDRFVTIATDTFPLSIPSGGPASYVCDRYVKLDLPVIFNAGNAGTEADIATGSLWLLSAAFGFAGTLPTLVYSTRVRFEDA